MTKANEPREAVYLFALEMEECLQANDHKGGWSGCRFEYLGCGIHQEFWELSREIWDCHFKTPREAYTAESLRKIIAEAADVANFAMMIADNARALLGDDDDKS